MSWVLRAPDAPWDDPVAVSLYMGRLNSGHRLLTLYTFGGPLHTGTELRVPHIDWRLWVVRRFGPLYPKVEQMLDTFACPPSSDFPDPGDGVLFGCYVYDAMHEGLRWAAVDYDHDFGDRVRPFPRYGIDYHD